MTAWVDRSSMACPLSITVGGLQLMASQAPIDGLGPLLVLLFWPLLVDESLSAVVLCILVSGNGRHHCGGGS
jgi:hypothetical protein